MPSGQVIDHQQIAGEKARKVDRVLDVRQGALCWITGTVYMDLPLKPNILDDVAKDVSYHYQHDHEVEKVTGCCEELRRCTPAPKDLYRPLKPRQNTNNARRRVRSSPNDG